MTSGWGDTDTSNKKRGVIPGGPYINIAAAWVSTVTSHLDDMPRILENLRTSAGHVRDDFRRQRRRDLMRRRSTSRNLIVNLRINCRGDDWEGPVTQYFLLQIFVASVRKISFFSSHNIQRG